MTSDGNNNSKRKRANDPPEGLEIPDAWKNADRVDFVDEGLEGIPLVWEDDSPPAKRERDEQNESDEKVAAPTSPSDFFPDDEGIPLELDESWFEASLKSGEPFLGDEGIPLTPFRDEKKAEEAREIVEEEIGEEEIGEEEIGEQEIVEEEIVEEEIGEEEIGEEEIVEEESDEEEIAEEESDEEEIVEQESDDEEEEEEENAKDGAATYSNEEDVARLKELVNAGDSEAMFQYARLCEEGSVVPRDSQRALLHYREAAFRGHARACVALGLSYRWGLGARVDDRKAFRWFRRGARENDAEALYQLGLCFAEGLGCEVDPKLAARCFRRASRAGVVEARLAYGSALLYGRGVARDVPLGTRILRQAARQGSSAAKGTLRAFLDELENAPKKDLSEPKSESIDFALGDLKFARAKK